MSVWQAVILVLVGCGLNVVTLEALVLEVSNCGILVTFSHFLGISLLGFLTTARCGRSKRHIPIQHYISMVALHFFLQVVNNVSLGYHISMPLHMILRSGSLLASLLLGVICLRRSYSTSKYVAVTMITVGIVMTSLASAPKEQLVDTHRVPLSEWLIGVGLVFVAVFASVGLGVLQERTYLRYGKHVNEALFYNHVLPLPGFMLFTSQIVATGNQFSQSPPTVWGLPWLWALLLANVATQYAGIRGVFILTAESSALTLTLVITLRKFCNLVFSVLYFGHVFTVWHWTGAILVFAGGLLFTGVHRRLWPESKLMMKKKT